MVEEQVTPFKRCHFEPCTFTHFRDGLVDLNGRDQRIVLSVYVDDGRTWDNCHTMSAMGSTRGSSPGSRSPWTAPPSS